MSSAVTVQTDKPVARPLHILVPLIKKDLEQANEAAQRAGLPYYRAAGEKMLEAKVQLKHGEFMPWLKRNFSISHDQAKRYMEFAEVTAGQNPLASGFSSLSDFVRRTSNPNYNKPHTVRPQAWHEPVKETIERARRDAERIREEQLNRAQERDEERKLALRLIDIGFKILSKELHPDKGGSRDAMARLNRVRDRLKASA